MNSPCHSSTCGRDNGGSDHIERKVNAHVDSSQGRRKTGENQYPSPPALYSRDEETEAEGPKECGVIARKRAVGRVGEKGVAQAYREGAWMIPEKANGPAQYKRGQEPGPDRNQRIPLVAHASNPQAYRQNGGHINEIFRGYLGERYRYDIR